MAKAPEHILLILCGGTGPRLWPLSRAENPKQFLKIFNQKSLLQQTYLRAQSIVTPKNIYIATNVRYASLIRQHLGSSLAPKNIISEPEKRNTAMAILYATAIINQHHPNAIITVLPSDHWISPVTKFFSSIRLTAKLADTLNMIITIGQKAASPNPAYGYIIPKDKNKNYYTVQKFIEKPNPDQASKLIDNHAFWNTGIYTFKTTTILSEFSRLSPAYYQLYQKLSVNLKKRSIVKTIYNQSENLPIDNVISEKTNKLLMIPSNFNWSDVGQWQSIKEQLPADKNKIVRLGTGFHLVSLESQNCLVNTNKNKLVALFNVKDLAVIDTTDALLICPLADSFNVRDIVAKITKSEELRHFFLKNK